MGVIGQGVVIREGSPEESAIYLWSSLYCIPLARAAELDAEFLRDVTVAAVSTVI